MRAVVIESHGGPEVLELKDVPRPTPASNEVLIVVDVVSVNRSFDLGVREGSYRRGTITLPLILGADPAGVIVELGSDVESLSVGDRVAVASSIACEVCPQCLAGHPEACFDQRTIGVHRNGGYAELVAVPAQNVYRVPEHLELGQASYAARHGSTALHQLQDIAKVQAGEWVLVMGGAGALGSAGIQLAHYLGARVIAAAGSDERCALTLEDGADHAVNYRTSDLAETVRGITGDGVHVVMENISDPELWKDAFSSLAVGGRLVTGGAHGGGIVPLDVKRLYTHRITIRGAVSATSDNVRTAIIAAAEGKLRGRIEQVFGLDQAAEAHEAALKATRGKVFLAPGLWRNEALGA